MKTNFKTFKFAAIALLATLGISCSDDDDPVTAPTQSNIVQIAQSNPDFSILVSALVRADLVTTLNGSGPFTVFAPTNAAFNSFLSANGYANIDAVPVPALKEVLLNHVLSGTVLSSDLETGYVKTLAKGSASASNTLSMFINVGDNVVINGGTANGGASVTTANLVASNGVIHVVNGVIGLPTVVNHAIANPNFSILVSALTRDDQPDFVSVLSGAGPFTVFAPTNDAFASLLAELSLAGLADVPQATLESTLKYHVVAGANVLASTLTNNQSVSTYLGQSFTVQLPGTGPQILDASLRTSKIIATDVQAANGVIHALDKVLLPSL